MTDDLVKRLSKENNLLRSALSHSKDPCIYCGLAADQLAQCCSGFPGCDRADDMINCPELGASLALKDADLRIEKLEAALRAVIDWDNTLVVEDGPFLGDVMNIVREALEGKDE